MDFNINVKTENRELPVPLETLRNIASAAFKMSGKKPGDISLVVCDDSFIHGLNRRYRGIDGPTDVLSFSMREGEAFDHGQNILGDIVISVDTAGRQAGINTKIRQGRIYADEADANEPLQKEFLFLYIHGLLHLLGYTHGDPESEKIMTDHVNKLISGVV
jgi:probable rRNA maturation factor